MSFSRRRWSLLLGPALAAVVACGGSDGGEGAVGAGGEAAPTSDNVVAVPGTPELSFTAASAIHAVGPDRTTVLLSDVPDLCGALRGNGGASCTAHGLTGAGRFLRIHVAGTTPGTYSGADVVAIAVAPGEVGVSAGAGRVELSAETADGRLTGSYDLGIVGKGTFTTERCDGLGDGGAAETTSRACSTSLQANGATVRFEETCECDGESSSRTCERGATESEWTCACTAPSGAEATCVAAASEDVLAAPENCCP